MKILQCLVERNMQLALEGSGLEVTIVALDGLIAGWEAFSASR
jgi:hypothetical protein